MFLFERYFSPIDPPLNSCEFMPGAMVDFQYHFIGNLLQMVSEPAVPPVLRTLCVPWMLLSILLSCCTRFSNCFFHFCGKHGLCGRGRNGETGASKASEGRLWKMGSTEKSSGSARCFASFVPADSAAVVRRGGRSQPGQPATLCSGRRFQASVRSSGRFCCGTCRGYTGARCSVEKTDCKAAFCDGLQADESSQSGQRNANFRKVEETPSMMVDTLCKFTYSTHIHIIHALQNAE